MNQACAVLHLRIEDNVLAEKDWPILRVVLDDYGKVLDQTVIKDGAYSFDHFNNLQDIVTWLNKDSTGYHPEIYHVLVPAP